MKSLVRQRVPGRPDGTVVSELVDVMEFAVDRLGEGEWIEARPQITERLQGRPIDACSRQETIEGRLRGVVDTADPHIDIGHCSSLPVPRPSRARAVAPAAGRGAALGAPSCRPARVPSAR